MKNEINQLTEQIIGCAIEVHRQLGPGLLESIYEAALAVKLELRSIPFERQRPTPIVYKGRPIGEHRLDLFVSRKVVVELKAVDRHDPVFDAQLLSYLKLTRCSIGLLINFNVPLLKDGIRRKILD